MPKRLTQEFYAQETITLARNLLGQQLVRRLHDGQRLSGRIVETEAYLGVEDPAAHSFGGRNTSRTSVMFAAPGTSYVYFIYGVYNCLNIVAMPAGTPEAVLIRAVEPREGIPYMRGRSKRPDAPLANGPGKLCVAFEIDRSLNGLDLTQSPALWVEEGQVIADCDIVEGARVGIGDRHDAVHWPLRFGLRAAEVSPAKFTGY